ncbi:MAG: hypothetical protein J6V25_07265 [Oscillospiraceae bacterium]|nr:hypothetical protein [Oscillospiraceae bacterium]
MKILFVNLPYYGHVVPTIGLVQELIRQGCTVTYLMPFGWEETVRESGAQFRGYPNHRQLSEQMKNAYAAADAIAEAFDLILYEQFFFLGKHLAQKHGKPAVRIFTAPATNEKLMQEYIHTKGPMSVFRHKWLCRAFTKDIAKEIPLKTDNWLDEILFNPPQLSLVYTLREYQPDVEDFPEDQFLFLGPSVYERAPQSLDFEKTDRPVVYISLGTVLKAPASFFRTCIEAFRDAPVDVILSAGKSFGSRALRKLPSNVHVYRTVPQTKVLEIADVFITHGGMNSVSEALVSSTPMVVIPFVSDQPVNGRCVEKLGVGKVLDYGDVNAEVLHRTVMALLSDQEVKRNLEAVHNMIRNAPGNRGAAQRIKQYGMQNDSR